jgi:excisionase family DNA binding protein
LLISDISNKLAVREGENHLGKDEMSNAEYTDDLPSPEAVSLARESAAALSRLLRERPESDRARVQLDGEELILPRSALSLLRNLLSEMAQGHAVTTIPVHAELTTQQAADMLNVSRPFLVKLLETDEIPHTRVGTHRRVRLKDLLEYKKQRDRKADAALQELADQAQDLDMGY